MVFIDLKFSENSGYPSISTWKGGTYEFGKNRLCSTVQISAYLRVSSMRPTLRGHLQSADLFLLGSILVHGFCSIDLSRKSSRHRSVSSRPTRKTLPHGNPQPHFPKYLSLYQRKSRLADLCRFCPRTHSTGSGVISPGRLRCGTGANRVRSRLHHHRFMSFSISLGSIPQTQRSCEITHPPGSARQHPHLVIITHGKIHDVNILDELPIETGAIYILDRGYLDFGRLYAIHRSFAFFITRAKINFAFQRLYSQPVDKTTGVQSDQIITLQGFYAQKDYPEKLRRVRYFDAQNNKRFVFLTNNFTLPALTIAELYRCRWQIELFFKWIKQHLRIKAFYGTSENAVKTQIWIAISVYVLVAIVKKRLRIDHSLYTILQILSVSLFEKIDLYQLLTNFNYTFPNEDPCNQLNLFA